MWWKPPLLLVTCYLFYHVQPDVIEAVMDIWYGPKVVIENVHRWFSLISIDVIMVQMFIFVLTTLIDAINFFVNTRKYFSILSNYDTNSLLYIIRISIWYSIVISLLLHQKFVAIANNNSRPGFLMVHQYLWVCHAYLAKVKVPKSQGISFSVFYSFDSCQNNLVNCTINIGNNFSSFP